MFPCFEHHSEMRSLKLFRFRSNPGDNTSFTQQQWVPESKHEACGPVREGLGLLEMFPAYCRGTHLRTCRSGQQAIAMPTRRRNCRYSRITTSRTRDLQATEGSNDDVRALSQQEAKKTSTKQPFRQREKKTGSCADLQVVSIGEHLHVFLYTRYSGREASR